MIKLVAKVYGRDGHRMKESFSKSYRYDFTEGSHIRIIEVINSDMTGTNDYSLVSIIRNSKAECHKELAGQLSDGIFESCRVGNVEIITIESV